MTGTRVADATTLRVRTGRDYLVSFTVDLGQRNVEFVKGGQAPLKRFVRWADAFGFFPGPRWDLIHTVNAVPLLSRAPFVIAFEDYLPRCPEDRKGGQWLNGPLRARLRSDRCRRLLPMSEFALRTFQRQQEGWEALPDVLAKTEVLYPAIDVRARQPKPANPSLQVCFVGKDFMRKGGPAVVRAHQRLRAAGIPIETTIVSSLRWSAEDYIGPPSQALYDEEVRRLAATEGVVHRGSLPNAETLRVMEASDYLVFPTLHDTFGFISLEAMSGGTPVIVTDTCAQPEIVEHGVSGFTLPFDNDETGRWRHLYDTGAPGYVDAYRSTIDDLTTALEERLARQWEERAGYEALSAGAIERVRTRFDRDRQRDRLEAIYRDRG